MTKDITRRERPGPNADGRARFWGDMQPPATKAEIFNAITTPAPTGDGDVATIRMYGPIDSWGGWWGISTREVGAVLDALPDSVETIVLRINSPGGECFEALAILNMLRAHKARIVAVVDGLAASAASVIAAGCDETVMSPGTQMMIHSPWTITWGNAAALRKEGDVLDGIEASLTEIYEAKAGGDDWATLLADETWFTAKQAVERGLADRVAVVPDAGQSETVGEDDELVVLVPVVDDDAEDSISIDRIAARAASLPRAQTPVSTEPGTTNRKETVVDNDEFQAALRDRLGQTADATSEQILAAVDAIAEQATAPTASTPTLPEGVVSIEASQLETLRADAAAGREARDAQIAAERTAAVRAAVEDGRIAPARQDHWVAQLEADPGAREVLDGLQPGLIPLESKAHTGGVDEASDEDAIYSKAFPASTPKEG